MDAGRCGDSRLESLPRAKPRAQPNAVRHSATPFSFLLVPSKGLEPPHRCRNMDLNHARLPIPPRWQSELQCSGGPKAAVSGRPTFPFLQPATSLSNAHSFAEARKPKPGLSQLGCHGNLRVQHLRYRTALLGGLGVLLKRRRIRSRNLPHYIEVARCNRPT